MAGSRGPTIFKRQKERAREERRQQKAQRRAQRKIERAGREAPTSGEDPDLVGIVPGPQPPPEES